MPRAHTIQLYQFDELSDAAKEKARAWYRHASDGDSFEADCVIDDAKAILHTLGFCNLKVYYSGFWSQGDGACFEGNWHASDVDYSALVAIIGEHTPGTEDHNSTVRGIGMELGTLAKLWPEASASIKHRGRYYHEQSTEFDCDFSNEDGYHVEPGEAFTELARNLMRWVYSSLEKDYEWRNEDEQVDENIRANEYEFTEDGKRA